MLLAELSAVPLQRLHAFTARRPTATSMPFLTWLEEQAKQPGRSKGRAIQHPNTINTNTQSAYMAGSSGGSPTAVGSGFVMGGARECVSAGAQDSGCSGASPCSFELDLTQLVSQLVVVREEQGGWWG